MFKPTLISKDPFNVVVETSRLFIRPFEQANLRDSFALFAEPRNTNLFMTGKPLDENQSLELIQKIGVGSPFGLYSIFLKDGAFIGHFFICQLDGETMESGTIIDYKYQNDGYGNECFMAMFKYCCYLLLEGYPINDVVVTAHPDNIRSWKGIEKLGIFTYLGEVRQYDQPRKKYLTRLSTILQARL